MPRPEGIFEPGGLYANYHRRPFESDEYYWQFESYTATVTLTNPNNPEPAEGGYTAGQSVGGRIPYVATFTGLSWGGPSQQYNDGVIFSSFIFLGFTVMQEVVRSLSAGFGNDQGSSTGNGPNGQGSSLVALSAASTSQLYAGGASAGFVRDPDVGSADSDATLELARAGFGLLLTFNTSEDGEGPGAFGGAPDVPVTDYLENANIVGAIEAGLDLLSETGDLGRLTRQLDKVYADAVEALIAQGFDADDAKAMLLMSVARSAPNTAGAVAEAVAVGDAVLEGSRHADTALGGTYRDWVELGRGDDIAYTGLGNDFADGGKGADTLIGGAGRDTLRGSDGEDVVHGGAGADRAFGGDGRDTLSGGDGADLLKGGRAADALSGGRGNDRLLGEAGNDALNGNLGRDTLEGGGGRDTMDGGKDQDTFVFRTGHGRDTILGFGAEADGGEIDLLRFVAGQSEITSMAAFKDAARQVNGDVVYDLNNDRKNVITLVDTDLDALGSANFDFS